MSLFEKFRTNSYFHAFLLLALCFLAFFPLLSAGFIWDDVDSIFVSEGSRSLTGLYKIWFHPTLLPQFYPVTFSALWGEYAIFGLNTFWFHFTQIFFHFCGALALASVLLAFEVPSAWIIATLWAVHPVQVETVAWIHERKNILSFLFAMLSLRTLLQISKSGRPNRLYALSLLFFCLAMLSKTTACSLPVVYLLLEWWKKGRIEKRECLKMIPFFAWGLCLAIVTVLVEKKHVGAVGSAFDIPLIQRFWIAGRALWFYLGKVIWPRPLIFIYPRWEWTSGWPWLFPFSWIASGILLLSFAIKKPGKPESRVLFMGWLAFSVILFPALGFVSVYPMIYSFVADHFQYMAMTIPIALASEGARRFFKNPRISVFVACTVITILGYSSWSRSHDYETLERLWEKTIEDNPGCWMAMNNLGVIYAKKGETERAMGLFLNALALNSLDVSAMQNLSRCYLKLHRAKEALPHLKKALELRPDLTLTQDLLTEAQSQIGR